MDRWPDLVEQTSAELPEETVSISAFYLKAGQGYKMLQTKKEKSLPLGFTFFSLTQKKGKGFYSLLRASNKYGGTCLHSVVTETAHPPVPMRTETEGNVNVGRQPRAQRHKNVGCCVPVLH